ncbi:TonB-dependent receptor plug domain-containing protein [Wenyingzhuangia fucanilytica]|nr:TonB-dependent receptor [Wenyingzhuangia fucanilytica]
MMKLCNAVFYICILWCTVTIAQNDSINRLEKVSLWSKITNASIVGGKEIKISDEKKQRNSSSLTDVLRYNSPVVFRDYGNGGVSTAVFRGTSATNTQVMWNGISINAVGNGQTDFNAIAAFASDEITVISGGNSVEYGSGAIGGVIRLDNKLLFNHTEKGEFYSSYGSFNTFTNYFKYAISLDKIAVKIALNHNKSDNDYIYVDDRYKDENGNDIKNINGNYHNLGGTLSLGYKFSSKNKLYFYSNFFNGERLFSAGLPNPKRGTEKFVDKNYRNLLKWEFNTNGYYHTLKAAYLEQEYNYYLYKTFSNYLYGKSKQTLTNYSINKQFSRYLKVFAELGYDYLQGENSDISQKNRKSFYQKLHLVSQPVNGLKTSLSFRNEQNSFYKLPFVYALGTDYELLPGFRIKANYSTNFRQPTNNELFWPQVGNLDLLPETSKQYDIGLAYKNKQIELVVNYFNIDLKNKILWIPVGDGNLWRPENIDDVLNNGIESFLSFQYKFNGVLFSNVLNYSYINAIDQQTTNRIPFVPKHSFNNNFSAAYKYLTLYYQQLYQSKVYTNLIQLDYYSLEALSVSNIGAEIKVLAKKNRLVKLGVKVNNVFNNVYYFTNLRPMPGRNYSVNINYKF